MRPFVRLIIRVIIVITPNNSIGPPLNSCEAVPPIFVYCEAGFDLFCILIYIAEKTISIASR